jgi:hypothetical protein
MALAVPTCSSSPDILPYPWITATALTPGVQPVSGFSVLVLLVVLAGFFLLITRRYPRVLFDLLSASTAALPCPQLRPATT